MKLSVIIVNYNVRYYVEQCLHSLERALEGIDSEVIVVDNHSHDGSLDYLTGRFPQVTFIESTRNLGFARGNNIAIRQSVGEYVLLLNPDTFVGEQTLHEAVRFLDDHPDAGAVGVKMHNSDGSLAPESRRGIPSPMTSLYKIVGLCKYFPRHPRYGHYYMSGMSWEKPGQIEIISGAFCMVRRKVLDQVGLLDEDFFMYGEDIDLSYRIYQAGIQNWYLPLPILHYKGESTQKSSFRYVHVFYQAMLIFFRKHYAHRGLWLTAPVSVAVFLRALITLCSSGVEHIGRSLGFYRRRQKDPQYIFIGGEKMLDDCQRLSNRYGLSARFIKADEQAAPRGHLQLLDQQPEVATFIVYDVHAYSYAQLLHIFGEAPNKNCSLGTYDTGTQVLITQTDVYK